MQLLGSSWLETGSVLSGDNLRWAMIGIAMLALAALRVVGRPRGRPRKVHWMPRSGKSTPSLKTFKSEFGTVARSEFDGAAQMKAIAPFEFETQPLLNKSETPLLYLLERIASEVGGGFRVMAQTSLGEIIRPKPGRGSSGEIAQAFRAINSKRLDFAIFNKFGKLVLGVEYQGRGHYHGGTFIRDAIKREVLRRAGVPMLEVSADYEAAKITAEVRDTLTAHRALLRAAEIVKVRPAFDKQKATT